MAINDTIDFVIGGEPSASPFTAVYDDYVDGVTDGVWLWDGAHPNCFVEQTTPTNGMEIVNLLDDGNDGDIVLTGSSALNFSGGGFKPTTAIASGQVPVGVRAPASILSEIWGGGTGLQHFLMFALVRLPTAAQWPAQVGSVNGFVSPVTINPGATYGSDPFMGMLAFDLNGSSQKQISFRRRLDSGSTYDALTIASGIPTDGPLALVAGWRTATERRLRILNDSIDLQASGASGAASTFDFSARRMVWGAAGGLAQTSPAYTPAWRSYYGGIENLEVTERDPMEVMDALWARLSDWIARGIYT